MRSLKFAIRTLFRTPFVTAVAIVSLALGIGATAGIFSVFHQVLRQSLAWDLAAVYPTDAMWADKMPPAVLINGPVVDVAREIADTVKAIRSRP